jgi:hypothetical protein
MRQVTHWRTFALRNSLRFFRSSWVADRCTGRTSRSRVSGFGPLAWGSKRAGGKAAGAPPFVTMPGVRNEDSPGEHRVSRGGLRNVNLVGQATGVPRAIF